MNSNVDMVYSTLLKEYDGEKMPTYKELAERTGLSRQTVSKIVKKLFEEEKIFRKNGLVYITAQYIDEEIVDEDADPLEELLKPVCPVIYGIVVQGELKYVGSTESLKNRMIDHINKRPFLTKKNFVVLKNCGLKPRFKQEAEVIAALNPPWNIMSKKKEI